MKLNNRHELRISQKLLSYLKSDLKQVKKAAKHESISQLIRYFIINGMYEIYGDNWTEFAKTNGFPEYEEYIKLQSGKSLEHYHLAQARLKDMANKRNKGESVDFQLPLFTEN